MSDDTGNADGIRPKVTVQCLFFTNFIVAINKPCTCCLGEWPKGFADRTACAACTVQLRCMDCDETVELDASQRYGSHFKCGDCHSSYRFCRDKVTGWAKLSSAEKKEYIVKNKGQGGRGKKRALIAVTKARRYEGCMYRYPYAKVLAMFAFDSYSQSERLPRPLSRQRPSKTRFPIGNAMFNKIPRFYLKSVFLINSQWNAGFIQLFLPRTAQGASSP